MNGLLSPVGVLKTLFPLCLAPQRVSQHIVILTTELPHRFFTRFLSRAIVSKRFFFFFTNESGVISDVIHIPAIPTLSPVRGVICHEFASVLLSFPAFLLLYTCACHPKMQDFVIEIHLPL